MEIDASSQDTPLDLTQSDKNQMSEQPSVPPSQPVTLQELVLADASSDEKRELLANSGAVFSGRCSPAEVRCLLATLDESDLRQLREKLRDNLTVAIPVS